MLKKIFIISIIITTINADQAIPPYLQEKNKWAEQTLQSMTLKEKIGQLFVVAAASDFDQPTEMLASSMLASPYIMDEEHVTSLIKNYHIGGVIFLYKSKPTKQINLTKKFQNCSKIPLLIALDAEWGLSMRLDKDPSKVVRYPRNMTLGALNDEQLVYQLGFEIGQQCAMLGVHLNCAPVVDVNNNAGNPVIHDRSFGDNPEKVAQLGALFAQGLQDAGVIACAKHFPGHGDTTVDSHIELPVIKHDKTRLKTIELKPFKKMIDQGVGAIMTAHLAIPALDATPQRPSSMSPEIVTNILKTTMNFKGLVITDGLGMRAITNHYKPGYLELEALLAGNDILLCPLDVPKAAALIEEALTNGRITQEDLNERVLKILKAKSWAFEQQKKYRQLNGEKFLVRPEAYDLQKKVYQQAITMVKQSDCIVDHKTLERSCILSIGTLPNNAFLKKLKPPASNVHSYSAQLIDAELQSCLAATKDSDNVIITLANITKCAHQQFGIADNTLALIKTLKDANKQIIVIVFGTPYCLPLLHKADTIIIAYEDAPAAQKAAAKIVRGEYVPTGKLPIKLLTKKQSPDFPPGIADTTN